MTSNRGASAAARIDEQYYQVAEPDSVSERLAITARDRIYADFIRLCEPRRTDRVLDVGVSDVVNDAANLLERLYPFPEQLTAVGLGHGTAFRSAYPKVKYLQIEPDRRLPFSDGEFDIAASNAVLEHVGSIERQRSFIAELTRVARKVFITVPHRFFPVEHHTAIPVLHFWDPSFRLACRLLGKSEWTDASNLILMTRRRLLALAQDNASAHVGYTGLRLGPFSSNLFLHIETKTPR